MERLLKQLKGHSGSDIFLMKGSEGLYVRKVRNVERNYERLLHLQNKYPVPKVLSYGNNTLDMEYIHGHDIKTFLLREDINKLLLFIVDLLQSFSKNCVRKNYVEVYKQKLQWLDSVSCFPFTKDELIQKLPSELPQSEYHGDLTLENILWSDSKFYLIDPVTVEYDSYVFDIAKLRQDLQCKWFLRDSDLRVDVKLKNIQDRILYLFPEANNNYILILMLLRVYLHTEHGDDNQKFILKCIAELWNSTD